MKFSNRYLLLLAVIGVGLVVLFTFLGNLLTGFVVSLMDLQQLANDALMQDGWLVLVVFAYIVLTAIPFVPGAEIGLTLLVIFGASIAGWIYLATVSALLLSFSLGRLVPAARLSEKLLSLGFVRAAAIVSNGHENIARAELFDIDPSKGKQRGLSALNWIYRHRVFALAALINTPGNSLIGGGGGIALTAGATRQISFRAFFACVLFAVAPIPVIVTLSSWIADGI